MIQPRKSQNPRNPRKPRFKKYLVWVATLGVGVGLVVLVMMVLREERTYRVTIHPGRKTVLKIETRLQRTFEHKSFAKQPGLSVVCELVPRPEGLVGVAVRVVGTGHRLHYMWANLEIEADPQAPLETLRLSARFTIEGEGGWPEPLVVVTVDR